MCHTTSHRPASQPSSQTGSRFRRSTKIWNNEKTPAAPLFLPPSSLLLRSPYWNDEDPASSPSFLLRPSERRSATIPNSFPKDQIWLPLIYFAKDYINYGSLALGDESIDECFKVQKKIMNFGLNGLPFQCDCKSWIARDKEGNLENILKLFPHSSPSLLQHWFSQSQIAVKHYRQPAFGGGNGGGGGGGGEETTIGHFHVGATL